MKPFEISVRCVGDLSREIRALSKSSQTWLFRGLVDFTWDLVPHVFRGYSPEQERYFTNEFRVRARSRHSECPSNNDFSGWLALMQHYGLPTRLLDWSYSPLIAAFFAVHPDYRPVGLPRDRDACIWALAAGALNQSQGFEPLIFPLDAASYVPLIEPAFKTRPEPGTIGVAMAIEHDRRIPAQQGAFTVHSNRTPLNRIAGCEQWLRKLVIPDEAVVSLLAELEWLGIRKSNLFPDLPALASELITIHQPGRGT